MFAHLTTASERRSGADRLLLLACAGSLAALALLAVGHSALLIALFAGLLVIGVRWQRELTTEAGGAARLNLAITALIQAEPRQARLRIVRDAQD